LSCLGESHSIALCAPPFFFEMTLSSPRLTRPCRDRRAIRSLRVRAPPGAHVARASAARLIPILFSHSIPTARLLTRPLQSLGRLGTTKVIMLSLCSSSSPPRMQTIPSIRSFHSSTASRGLLPHVALSRLPLVPPHEPTKGGRGTCAGRPPCRGAVIGRWGFVQ
jgi:hypothetical protein